MAHLDPGDPPTDIDEPSDTLGEETEHSRAYAVGAALAPVIVLVSILALLAVMVGAVVLSVYLIVVSDPGDVTPKDDAGYLDIILVHRHVVWAARVLLYAVALTAFAVAVYAVASIGVRIRRGHWLRAGAGLHADTARDLSRDLELVEEQYDQLLDEAQREKEDLLTQLAATTDALEEATEARDWLLAELERLGPGLKEENEGGR